VGPAAWLPATLFIEDESGRVMLEVGLLGFLAIYGLRLTLIFLAFQQSLRLRDRFCRALAVSSLLFFLTHLPSGIIFNVTASLYFWFFSGLLFTAMRLDGALVAVSRRQLAPGTTVRALGHPAHP
jgi:hypothetical protein